MHSHKCLNASVEGSLLLTLNVESISERLPCDFVALYLKKKNNFGKKKLNKKYKQQIYFYVFLQAVL